MNPSLANRRLDEGSTVCVPGAFHCGRKLAGASNCAARLNSDANPPHFKVLRTAMLSGALGLVIFICGMTISGAAEDLAAIYEQGPARLEGRARTGAPSPSEQIDALVFAQCRAKNIEPANLGSDAVFLRRTYLDVIGTLPTGLEAQEFLRSTDPNKRELLVDRLLAREEFIDYQANRWCDLLRVKAEFPINLWPNAVQAYHRFIRDSIKTNKPYDEFVRELLTASGSNFRVGPVNFYRAVQSRDPQSLARTVAVTFMGARAEHWPEQRLQGMAGFFAQVGFKSTAEWKEEIVFHDPSGDTNEWTKRAAFPDGTPARLGVDQDPREAFADWLITPENPWFTRNIANRVWSWLLGRGITHEPDDIRPDNPPSNPELLAFLQSELIAAEYDLKHLYRIILKSQTYQLSCIPKTDTPEAAAQFAHYPLRRLDAEVLIDALNQLTGSQEKYSSAIPEPFTFLPENQRAIAIPDGSITSPFLETFGRPARDTGLESERNNTITAAQRLHLLNSSHVQQKIEQSRMIQYQTSSKKTPRQIASALYLGILSRYPTEAELETLERALPGQSGRGREMAIDLAWALMNSAEFLYRH